MGVSMVMIVLIAAGLGIQESLVAGDCSTSADIAQVFVVHRRLKFAPFAVCKLDHSALILRTRDDKECVLEYLKDSKAHLYDAKPVFKSGCGTSWFSRRKKKCMYIMKDDTGIYYRWTRQKVGAHFPASAGHMSPQMAQERMQRIMGNNYDFLDNNCHMAQEKLRQAWGLPVHDPYLKTAAICGCGKKLDGFTATNQSSGSLAKYERSVPGSLRNSRSVTSSFGVEFASR